MVNKNKLLVLAYSINPCYTNLVRLSELEENISTMRDVYPEDLKIDVRRGIWSFRNWQNIPIGKGRNYSDSQWGIIGVYDQSKYEHIRQLVDDAQEALNRPQHGHMASDD